MKHLAVLLEAKRYSLVYSESAGGHDHVSAVSDFRILLLNRRGAQRFRQR